MHNQSGRKTGQKGSIHGVPKNVDEERKEEKTVAEINKGGRLQYMGGQEEEVFWEVIKKVGVTQTGTREFGQEDVKVFLAAISPQSKKGCDRKEKK